MIKARQNRDLPAQAQKAFLSAAATALQVTKRRFVDLEATAENALAALQNVGSTTKNLLCTTYFNLAAIGIPYDTLVKARRNDLLLRLLFLVHGSILSRLGASTMPGAIQAKGSG